MTTDSTTISETVRLAFVRQANACRDLGSPFTALLCDLAAERLTADHTVGKAILFWEGDPSPGGDSVPLRFAGALHAIVLAGIDQQLTAAYPPAVSDAETLWLAVERACRTHAPFILDRLTSAPQTNEVRRSAALLPGFLTISRLFAKPLVLSEVGASAGLNMHWDRYAYKFGSVGYAPSPSPVEIATDWKGNLPPDGSVDVAGRAGCDLNPLDPDNEQDAMRLLSYVWADQSDRLHRLRQALALAAAHPERVAKADAVDWLEERLAAVHDGHVHVIYHTIAWQYLPPDLRAKGDRLIADAGRRSTEDAPLARLSMEADDQKHSAALTLQIWPSGERRLIGRADFHGRWIDWHGWSD